MGWAFFPAGEIHPVDRAGRRKAATFVGRTTRMGVEQVQNYTLWINDDRDGRPGRYLTDQQLCADWQHEFPDAVTFAPFHVEGVRRDFQSGQDRHDTGSGSSHGVRGASGDVAEAATSRQYR